MPQCLCYKMHLIVNLSHRDIWECSDATVMFVTGALGGLGYLTEHCTEPKQMSWVYGLHEDCLLGARSVTRVSVSQVQRATCETESQGNNQYKSLGKITSWRSDVPLGDSNMQSFALV